jgi:hypothetical protein
MSTTTPVTSTPASTTPIPSTPSPAREAMRRTGVVALFGASTAAAYVGLRFQMPLLFAPFLCALGGAFLPKGNVTRTVLFSIAAVGCVAVAAIAVFLLLLIMTFSGAQFG